MNREPVEPNTKYNQCFIKVVGVVAGVSIASILTLVIVLTIGVSELNSDIKNKPLQTTTTVQNTTITTTTQPPTITNASTTVLPNVTNTVLSNVSSNVSVATVTTTAPLF